MRKLLVALLFIGMGCNKETPLAPLRIEDPEPIPGPAPLPQPRIRYSWFYDANLGQPGGGWRSRIHMNLSSEPAGAVENTSHFRIDYTESGHNTWSRETWVWYTQIYVFPHLFIVSNGIPEIQNDYGCYEVMVTAVAKEGQDDFKRVSLVPELVARSCKYLPVIRGSCRKLRLETRTKAHSRGGDWDTLPKGVLRAWW